MSEEWRSVLDGYYEVSDLGNVRRAKPAGHWASCGTSVGRPVKTTPRSCGGYLAIHASTGSGKAKTINVHQLVAGAFLGPCPDGWQVNHKDLNKQNNRLENLEYVTGSGNQLHTIKTRGRWHITWNTKLNHEQREQLCGLRLAGLSIAELGENFGISAAGVYGILKRRGLHQRWPRHA